MRPTYLCDDLDPANFDMSDPYYAAYIEQIGSWAETADADYTDAE